MIKRSALWLPNLFVAALVNSQFTIAQESNDGQPQIEEVLIYGQKSESTVSDISISITAMDQGFLEDMGIQGPDEIINFIPATTRTDWDIKIRGVGRNFRGLGGDPGVGTYYNGIYSPDFGIASTEGGLFDIKRVEVLRGPQGTLYGRNSIGGVLNYVTNQANHEEFEGQAKLVLGDYNTNEWYGVVSGPVNDALAFRLAGSQRNSDGRIEGFADAPDVEDADDRNIVLTLDWIISDSLTANLRINDRVSDRMGNFGNGGNGILSDGPCISKNGGRVTDLDQCDPKYRVARDTNYYAQGLRLVDADFEGAFPYVHPVTGENFYATYKRPGVDQTIWPYLPSPNYMDPNVAAYDPGSNTKPDLLSLTNGFAHEGFKHRTGSLTVNWDISDTLALTYLGSYQSFQYSYDRDNDFSSSKMSSTGDTVLEDVWSFSHELRVFWELGERWTATSGIFQFLENRRQEYGIRNSLAKGIAVNPAIYGPEGNESWIKDGLALVGWVMPECFDWMNAEVNAPGGYGTFCGDPGIAHSGPLTDTGAVYEQDNYVETENLAFYTQGDFIISDTLSVTLGVRYSEDTREVLESRGGYSELEADDYAPWMQWALATSAPEGFDANQFYGEGVTPLAAINVAMGAATFTGDPENPIASVCPLTAINCDRPLRLAGIPISFGSRAAAEYETDNFSYRVNFNWEPTDELLIYAGVTTSYRAGGYDLGGTSNREDVDTDGDGVVDVTALTSYDDEELTSYEIGYKGTYLDNRLQINASIYYYDYKNYQDSISRWETESADFVLPAGIEPPAGRGAVLVTTNIPEASNKGFEIDMVFAASQAMTIGGNYSYTESTWDSPFTFFNDNDPRYPIDIFAGDINDDPCSLSPEIAELYCIQAEGIQLPGIPKHKASFWGSYQWEMEKGSLTFYTSVSYTGDYFTSVFARPWDEVPERYRTDMRLSFLSNDQSWSASVFVDNVMDDTYIRWSDMSQRLSGHATNFPHRAVALMPRYVGAEFVYNF